MRSIYMTKGEIDRQRTHKQTGDLETHTKQGADFEDKQKLHQKEAHRRRLPIYCIRDLIRYENIYFGFPTSYFHVRDNKLTEKQS